MKSPDGQNQYTQECLFRYPLSTQWLVGFSVQNDEGKPKSFFFLLSEAQFMFFGRDGSLEPYERAVTLTAINWRGFFFFCFGFYGASTLLTFLLTTLILCNQEEHKSQSKKAEYVPTFSCNNIAA